MLDRRALVCAPRMPEYDREGGSRRLFHFLEFFQLAGWSESFAAESSRGGERYARGLQQKSIPTYALTQTEAGDGEAPDKLRLVCGSCGRLQTILHVSAIGMD